VEGIVFEDGGKAPFVFSSSSVLSSAARTITYFRLLRTNYLSPQSCLIQHEEDEEEEEEGEEMPFPLAYGGNPHRSLQLTSQKMSVR